MVVKGVSCYAKCSKGSTIVFIFVNVWVFPRVIFGNYFYFQPSISDGILSILCRLRVQASSSRKVVSRLVSGKKVRGHYSKFSLMSPGGIRYQSV